MKSSILFQLFPLSVIYLRLYTLTIRKYWSWRMLACSSDSKINSSSPFKNANFQGTESRVFSRNNSFSILISVWRRDYRRFKSFHPRIKLVSPRIEEIQLAGTGVTSFVARERERERKKETRKNTVYFKPYWRSIFSPHFLLLLLLSLYSFFTTRIISRGVWANLPPIPRVKSMLFLVICETFAASFK